MANARRASGIRAHPYQLQAANDKRVVSQGNYCLLSQVLQLLVAHFAVGDLSEGFRALPNDVCGVYAAI